MKSADEKAIKATIIKELSGFVASPCLETEKDAGIIFIGLGGIGCRTVAKIKEKYNNKYKNNGSVAFLAIDSDAQNLFNLRHKGGYPLDKTEVFSLFTDAVHKASKNFPPEANTWCRCAPRIPPQPGSSAAGMRRAGRFMLCATENYALIKKEISNIIFRLHNAGNPKIRIFLVASLVGGTGGGIFTDTAYMINNILKSISPTISESSLYGVCYLPDVFDRDLEFSGEQVSLIHANGYAALKELDYFMSMKRSGSLADSYSISVPGVGKITMSEPPFKEGCIMPVSPTGEVYYIGRIIENTADALLLMSLRADEIGGSFINLQTSSLLPGDITEKMLGRFKAENRKNKPWLKYIPFVETGYVASAYASLGAYRIRLYNYCGNRILQRLERFMADNARSCDVDKIVHFCSLGSAEDAIGALKKEVFGADFRVRFDEEDPLYPKPRIFKESENLKEIIGYMNEKARTAFGFIEPHLEMLVNNLVLNTKNILAEQIVTREKLMTIGARNIRMLLDRFQCTVRRNLDRAEELEVYVTINAEKLDSISVELDKSLFAGKKKTEEFARTCEMYATARLDKAIGDCVIYRLIDGVTDAARELGKEFEPFELVDTCISDFNDVFNTKATYDMPRLANLYGICDTNENENRLFGFINRWLDTINIAALCWNERELGQIYGSQNGEFDFSIAAKLLRMKLDKVTAPLVRRAEGLIMVAFDTEGVIKNFGDIDCITDKAPLAIWKERRDKIATRVAEYILDCFGDRLEPQPGYMKRDYDAHKERMMICIPKDWKVIEAAIAALAPNVVMCPTEDENAISCVKLSAPLELFRLEKITTWAQDYDWRNEITLHLDSEPDNRTMYLPEICGADAAACYNEWGIDTKCIEQLVHKDKVIYGIIARSLDFCLESGLIRKVAEKNKISYTVSSICEKTELVRSTAQRLRKVLPKGIMSEEVEAMLRVVISTFDEAFVSGKLEGPANLAYVEYFKEDEQIQPSEDFCADTIKNIHRLIRSDLRYANLVCRADEGQLAVEDLKRLIGI